MRLVKRGDLLEMGDVLYAPVGEEFPEQLYIKYGESYNNNFSEETFPITYPDIKGNYYDTLKFVMDNKDQEYTVSDLETVSESTYASQETEYWVYSKEDIRKMIGKLQHLLGLEENKHECD